MTEKNEGGSSKLELPSPGYRRARESGVSQLSELMFGSLLASYVLGFVSFAAAASPLSSDTYSRSALKRLIGSGIAFDYLAISLTFTFITAALYVSYHIGILTMPTTPFHRLSWDFFIALAQACCFGFSLLLRDLFPAFLSVALLLTLWRQRFESRKLLGALTDPFERSVRQTANPRDSDEMNQQVREYTKHLNRAIRTKIERRHELVGWQGVQRGSIGAVIGLLIIAIVAGFGWLEKVPFVRDANGLSYLHLTIHAIIAIVTGSFANVAIKKRGTLLVDLVSEKRQPGTSDPATSTSDNSADFVLSHFDRVAKAFYSEVKELCEKAEADFKASHRGRES